MAAGDHSGGNMHQSIRIKIDCGRLQLASSRRSGQWLTRVYHAPGSCSSPPLGTKIAPVDICLDSHFGLESLARPGSFDINGWSVRVRSEGHPARFFQSCQSLSRQFRPPLSLGEDSAFRFRHIARPISQIIPSVSVHPFTEVSVSWTKCGVPC